MLQNNILMKSLVRNNEIWARLKPPAETASQHPDASTNDPSTHKRRKTHNSACLPSSILLRQHANQTLYYTVSHREAFVMIISRKIQSGAFSFPSTYISCTLYAQHLPPISFHSLGRPTPTLWSEFWVTLLTSLWMWHLEKGLKIV